jgi:protein FRA10AC1
LFKQAFNRLFSLIVVHYERCAEKLAYKRQKEKEKENELSGEKEIELKDSDKRKRYF